MKIDAKDPIIRKLQQRLQNLMAVTPPPKTTYQLVEQSRLSPFEREKQFISSLMGGESIFNEASFLCPGFFETQVTKFLADTFHPSGKRTGILLGSPGAGKTFACIAYLAREQAYQVHQSAAFITAYDLGYLISKKNFEALEKLAAKKWLLLDDLGTEAGGFKGRDTVAHFENLFSERHRKLKRTLITSNANMEQIKEIYGERFISRLREIGMVFETADSDYRGKEA